MNIEVENDNKGDSDDEDEDDGIEVDEDEGLEEGFGGTEAETQEAVASDEALGTDKALKEGLRLKRQQFQTRLWGPTRP